MSDQDIITTITTIKTTTRMSGQDLITTITAIKTTT